MLYAIVGVGLNAMPMAAFQDALTNLTGAGAYNVVVARRQLLHNSSNLSAGGNVTSPENVRVRKSEVEMQVLQSLDQEMI